MRFIIKKLLSTIATLLIVSLCVFAAFSVIPGDPARAMLGTDASEAAVERLREEMGLNAPFISRYGKWIAGFVRGDLGESYKYSKPVSELLLDKVPVTLTMTLFAFLMILILSIPLSIISARHKDGIIDKIIVIITQINMAIPPFFSGFIITLILGLGLRFFVPGGYVSYSEDSGAFLYYMIFPALAIAIPKSAQTVKLMRGSLINESGKDYVRTSLSRGATENYVFYGHILKNAMIPSITFLGMVLSDIVAGSIVIEQVFGIPGFGRILLTAIEGRDYPVVEAIIMFLAIIVIVIYFITDILYRVIDPRID